MLTVQAIFFIIENIFRLSHIVEVVVLKLDLICMQILVILKDKFYLF